MITDVLKEQVRETVHTGERGVKVTDMCVTVG